MTIVNLNKDTNIFCQENAPKNVVCKMVAICFGHNVLEANTNRAYVFVEWI